MSDSNLQIFADSIGSGSYQVTSSKSARKVYFVDDIPVYPESHADGVFYIANTEKWPKEKCKRIFLDAAYSWSGRSYAGDAKVQFGSASIDCHLISRTCTAPKVCS